jgi:hypothetical protein
MALKSKSSGTAESGSSSDAEATKKKGNTKAASRKSASTVSTAPPFKFKFPKPVVLLKRLDLLQCFSCNCYFADAFELTRDHFYETPFRAKSFRTKGWSFSRNTFVESVTFIERLKRLSMKVTLSMKV